MTSPQKWSTKTGKYTFVRKISSGCNGIVYEVKNNSNNHFALKELMRIHKSKPYNRFKDEIAVLNGLKNHVGIIPLLDEYFPDSPSDSDRPFYVMPVGVSLERFLKNKSDDVLFKNFLHLCSALKVLHDKGITHRDIKPDNILVVNDQPVFSDFGLANFPEQKRQSDHHEAIGPRWTIAPEMKRISSVSDYKKADIYSLAKTLWMLITRRGLSFEGQYVPDSIIGIRRYVDVKINVTTGVEWGYHSVVLLDRLLASATSNDPNERPDIDEFIRQLDYWLFSNDEYNERNPYEWEDALRRLFPLSIPFHAEWNKLEDIYNVLRVLTQYDSLNHMFFPGHGGLDMDQIGKAKEAGCVVMLGDILVKPVKLIFEMIDNLAWSYFRLEVGELQPITKTKGIEESVYLNKRGLYQKKPNEDTVEITRYFKECSFVITFKTSSINGIDGPLDGYSGIHNM